MRPLWAEDRRPERPASTSISAMPTASAPVEEARRLICARARCWSVRPAREFGAGFIWRASRRSCRAAIPYQSAAESFWDGFAEAHGIDPPKVGRGVSTELVARPRWKWWPRALARP